MTVTEPDRIDRALVTGASSGIGEEFARQLAPRGVDLVLVARREDRLNEIARQLESTHGVTVEVLPADLADPAARERVETLLGDLAQPVDLLVNNAGFGAYGRFEDIDVDRQTAMVDVNVLALVRLSHAVLPGLRGRHCGGIINVASTASFQPGPFGATYGATKRFVLTFSQALHEEAKRDGVRVTALCPGVTTTEFQDVADVAGGAVPDAVAMTADDVVRDGLAAFTRGRAVCVPGLVNRAGALAAEVAPGLMSRRVAGLLHRRFASGR